MEQRKEMKENKMGTMPVNRLLLTMSLPMMASMLVQALSSDTEKDNQKNSNTQIILHCISSCF